MSRASDKTVQIRPVELLGVNGHPVDTYPVVGASTLVPTTTEVAVTLPPVAACSHQPRLTVFILDESGSVTAHNDPARPIANRHRETQLALDHLGACRCGNELAAIIYFDPGQHDTGPHPLTRRGHKLLRAGIANSPNFTGSNLDAALDDVHDLAAAHPGHTATVVVLSDFCIFDPDPDATLDRLCSFPGDTHAVVLSAPIPARLEADPAVTVTHITWDSQPGEVARALVPALAGGRRTTATGQ